MKYEWLNMKNNTDKDTSKNEKALPHNCDNAFLSLIFHI